MPKVLLVHLGPDTQDAARRVRTWFHAILGAKWIVDEVDASATTTPQSDIIADALLVLADGRGHGPEREQDAPHFAVVEALKSGRPVLGALVGARVMPKPEDLPALLRGLSIQDIVLLDAGRDFDTGMIRLATRLVERLGPGLVEPSEKAMIGMLARDNTAQRIAPATSIEKSRPRLLSFDDMARLYAAANVVPTGIAGGISGPLLPPMVPEAQSVPSAARSHSLRARSLGMFSSVAAFAVVAAAGTYTYFRSGALTGSQDAWDGPRGIREIAQRPTVSSDSMPFPFGPPIIGGEQPWNASNFECIASGRSEVRSNGPESLTIGAGSDAVSLYPFSVHSNLSFRARIEFLPGAKQPGTDGHAGLAFRASGRDDYYAASVFADGAYAVFHRIGDAWQAIVPKTSPEAGSAALKSGADVEVKLDAFTTAISVNGRTVPNLKIDGPAEGRLGYYVAAGHNPTDKWKFSNVLVRCGPPERNRQPAVRNDAKPSVVDVSAFSPEGGRPGEEILVQVFLHQPRQAAKAASLAQEADPDSRRRGVATLETEIAVGQKVEIRLDAPGLSVEDAIQQVTWRGEPRACQFLVTFPADAGGRSYPVRVRILVESVPVGKLTFQLRGAAPEQAVDTAAGLRGDKAQRYRQAFLSYSSADRVEVLKGAQYLKAAGIDFFQDLLSIEPGERWAARIFEEIDRCDLFLLCWSSNASGSEWVIKEAEYALRRHKASAEEMPDIIPLLLEGPPVPLPPPSLSDIHFNDPLRYVIFAEEQSRRTR